MTCKSQTDDSHETTLTYFEWVDGILEQHKIRPKPPADPKKKADRSAA